MHVWDSKWIKMNKILNYKVVNIKYYNFCLGQFSLSFEKIRKIKISKLKQNFRAITILNKKIVNYEDENFFKYYHFSLGHFSIQGHYKTSNMNFKLWKIKKKIGALNDFKWKVINNKFVDLLEW